jgi:hypothetical protein
LKPKDSTVTIMFRKFPVLDEDFLEFRLQLTCEKLARVDDVIRLLLEKLQLFPLQPRRPSPIRPFTGERMRPSRLFETAGQAPRPTPPERGFRSPLRGAVRELGPSSARARPLLISIPMAMRSRSVPPSLSFRDQAEKFSISMIGRLSTQK